MDKRGLKTQRKPSKLQSRWQISSPRWGSTSSLYPEVTFTLSVPSTLHPSAPWALPPTGSFASSAACPDCISAYFANFSPGALWASPAHPRAIQPSAGTATCPLAAASLSRAGELPSGQPSYRVHTASAPALREGLQETLQVSPAHAAPAPQTHPSPEHSGTIPMAQSSCFHLLHSLEQDCYPEPTQMPMCLLTVTESPTVP